MEGETDAQREYRLSSCQGKEAFDRATANMVARKSKHAAVKPFRCKACGHWHVGQAHKPKKRTRKVRGHVQV